MKHDDSNKSTKPWLNEKEQPLATTEIKAICSQWNSQTWEDYLSSLEAPQTELLLDDPDTIDEYSQEEFSLSNIMSTANDFPRLKELISKILGHLPKNQRIVIHSIFWEGIGVNNLAKKTGVSKSAIQQTRDRALKQISRILLDTIIKAPKKKRGPEMAP